ncbi:MAG TPA: phage tail sheath C-terminal domain-containing protein [Sphingomicrobium sp.]|nr:phage tail sheath C-terminal domain-containing protein [Sphingomicrobium sp.]
MFGGHRLPGIAFETVVAPAPEALPPMDVALFAGFAAMGPAHRPVPVEDFAQFRRVFGDTHPLAYDASTGETVGTALAPTVRAFFANGGRRCWIVRVLRTEALEAVRDGSRNLPPEGDGVASVGRFELPGLVAVDLDGQLVPARAQARSLGSWSDRLGVAARVERRPFSYRGLEVDGTELTLSASQPLEPGDLVEFEDSQGTIYARIDEVNGQRAKAFLIPFCLPAPPPASPPEASPPIASPPSGSTPELPPSALLEPGARAPMPNARAARVSLELRVNDGADRFTLSGIGLTPLHAQSWWKHLPDDRRPDDFSPPGLPIAVDNAELDRPPLVWLPVGLTGQFSEPVAIDHDGRTALERDGLSRLGEDLFLDPRLAQIGTGRLLEDAERILQLDGRPLFGIHSVLGINDAGDFNPVSLLAVPDAVQRGWIERDRRLSAPPARSKISPPAHWFDHRGPCASVSPESELAADLDRSAFLDCATRVLASPIFEAVDETRAPGALPLRWSSVGANCTYTLEIARSAGFDDAEIVYEGPETSYVIDLLGEGFYYFRLRAREADEVSFPALLALAVRASDWTMLSAEAYSSAALLAVQRGLLRLAAASGDMFALLSLPRHYRAAEAVDHARRLSRWRRGGFGDSTLFDGNERRTLSFGALHHPWTVSFATDEKVLVAAPPEGAIAGVHARRTRDRGAWIAAANERLRDVVALEPAIGDADWPACDLNRVNLIRRDSRGFLLLDADTLSDEPEWRQINVRRLMSLLRRVSIRRGASYVFEPNSDVLRRAVERGFTELLDRLFRLGAFVGRIPEQAYGLSVATTAADRESGRLVVEIGVAPAQPMRFVTVRLVQSGGRFAVEEG